MGRCPRQGHGDAISSRFSATRRRRLLLELIRTAKGNVKSPARIRGNSARSPLRRSGGGLTPSAPGRARTKRPPRDNAPAYACPRLVGPAPMECPKDLTAPVFVKAPKRLRFLLMVLKTASVYLLVASTVSQLDAVD